MMKYFSPVPDEIIYNNPYLLFSLTPYQVGSALGSVEGGIPAKIGQLEKALNEKGQPAVENEHE